MSEEKEKYTVNQAPRGFLKMTCSECGKVDVRHWAAVRCIHCGGRMKQADDTTPQAWPERREE